MITYVSLIIVFFSVSTRLKNMLVKMGIFPNFRGENSKKCLKPPTSTYLTLRLLVLLLDLIGRPSSTKIHFKNRFKSTHPFLAIHAWYIDVNSIYIYIIYIPTHLP